MDKDTQQIQEVLNQLHSPNLQQTSAVNFDYWRSQVTDEDFVKIEAKVLQDKKARYMKLMPSNVDLLSEIVQQGLAKITVTGEEVAPILKRWVQAIEGKKANIEYAKRVYSDDKHFIPAHYNLSAMREFLCWWYYAELPKGREMNLTAEYRRIYGQVCKYYCEDPTCEYDLEKGLMFIGRVGDGKTMLMRAFQNNQRKSYRVVSASDIAEQYKEHGIEVLKTYRTDGRQSRNRFGQIEHGWCIDDIGAEDVLRNYGDKVNVVEYIVTKRFDEGLLTHFTTNLNAESLLSTYGERVVSRLRQMVNQIVLPNIDLRK